MSIPPTIVWFQSDLRIHDHPALWAAAELGGPILPVFVWSPDEEAPWSPGAASRWWLHRSLASLEAELASIGLPLVLRRGPVEAVLLELVRECRAGAVYWNRRYEPGMRARDRRVERVLGREGLSARTFNGALLYEPWDISNQQGNPYKVFTPYWRACRAGPEPRAPVGVPRGLVAPETIPSRLPIDEFRLEPQVDWAGGLREAWTPGRAGAQAELDRFLDRGLATYDEDRDRPDRVGTSRLSPHLHFGECSPHEVWHAVSLQANLDSASGIIRGAESYVRELGWREFSHHLLHHFPRTPRHPLRPEFEDFPWRRNRRTLEAWKRGRTGYPIVDAGMRQLWKTGWMHNRVRMIVASFLIKDLNIPWQEGATYFWDTLVDADLANNTMGWQWAAGCGADAAPYFRVFNPITQGERFDPKGDYIRAYIPELRDVSSRSIHRPWETSDAGSYPLPMVNHAEARLQALSLYQAFKAGGGETP